MQSKQYEIAAIDRALYRGSKQEARCDVGEKVVSSKSFHHRPCRLSSWRVRQCPQFQHNHITFSSHTVAIIFPHFPIYWVLGVRKTIDPRSIISFAFILVAVVTMLSSTESQALPSFARQTGMPCSACHVQAFGPNLTPTGRNFKLYGYTQTADDRTKMIPLTGMIRGSFTHTNSDLPGGAADRFGPNNNATIDEASVFYAGRVNPK